jgi:hypothetical protein
MYLFVYVALVKVIKVAIKSNVVSLVANLTPAILKVPLL